MVDAAAAAEPAVRWINAAPSDGARRNRSLVAYDLAASRRSFRVEQRWDDCFRSAAAAEPAVRWINAAPSDGARRNRSLVAYDLAASRRSFRVEQRWDDCFEL